jgi:hypothetical protein
MAITNETHGFWRFFFHSISLKKKSPLVHMNQTHEIDEPYRWSKSLILRLPWATRGLVLGWWRNTTRTEDEAILAGMQGRPLDMSVILKEVKNVESKKN